ncbi:GNAT family N-acetyltransferase [Agrilutibacter solisilvae]|uniref:GNAT family N-acetyltransferase n=1 Tax=Agrilutibacter solisilvae TaxID=2763317 RepID=A0A975AQQ3_9GAMM|nr:GNAT family N-acetyltransferase [Lysobacter solisilvae]QSX77164.1 GNAT family N-acetyltransferase [Lysobacter solisilvae]
MTIRPARHGDHAFILGLCERFTSFELPLGRDRAVVTQVLHDDIDKHLRQDTPDSFFFVIEDGGQRAGFVHLQLMTDFFGRGRNCHVSDLAIDAAFEGRGLASALLRHSETFGRENGCAQVTLSVFPANTRARELYERQGFSMELLRMAKRLEP